MAPKSFTTAIKASNHISGYRHFSLLTPLATHTTSEPSVRVHVTLPIMKLILLNERRIKNGTRFSLDLRSLKHPQRDSDFATTLS
jgi:hypothetical protein